MTSEVEREEPGADEPNRQTPSGQAQRASDAAATDVSSAVSRPEAAPFETLKNPTATGWGASATSASATPAGREGAPASLPSSSLLSSAAAGGEGVLASSAGPAAAGGEGAFASSAGPAAAGGEGALASSAGPAAAGGERPNVLASVTMGAIGLPASGQRLPFPEAAEPPPEDVPELAPGVKPRFIITFRRWIRDYFLGEDPSFGLALVPFCFLSMFLFTRHPTRTNFIFDEQEALLANPYVRSVAEAQPKFGWLDAFYRDFWGLGPERSIGSYRPIPNLVWRALWGLGARDQTPFLHHWVNVLLHGVNGALVCVLAFSITKRRDVAWISGAAFTGCALLTEAVSGVVGIADVLGATGALLALLALTLKLPWMVLGVFLASLFGLYSKESALCCVPLLPLGALFLAPTLHPEKPRRWLRAIVAFVAVAAAFVLYVEARRRMFPAPIPQELSVAANEGKGLGARTFAAILRWYAQPTLPKDPLNNPLVNADGIHRVAGALRVWFRGLVQIVFPHTLSGDYSSPQEPVPTTVFTPEIILGALAMIVPIPVAAYLGMRSYRRFERAERESSSPTAGASPTVGAAMDARSATTESDVSKLRNGDRPMTPSADPSLVVAFGMLWVILSYFPVSNLPVLLPTVRAERFWYFPVIGSSLLIGVAFGGLVDRIRAITRRPTSSPALGKNVFALAAEAPARNRKVVFAERALFAGTLAFFAFQAWAARSHANDYTDDLSFWDATRKAVPRSAKAHLNYSVMKGARGDLEARLQANAIALELAPQWPMASVYYGDTLCRLHRAKEAWPHYIRGFELAPNDVNLVALGVQCMWDEKLLVEGSEVRDELATLKDKYPGSWLEYIGRDVLEHGEEHSGVDPKYRPRGYNEGPKD